MINKDIKQAVEKDMAKEEEEGKCEAIIPTAKLYLATPYSKRPQVEWVHEATDALNFRQQSYSTQGSFPVRPPV